jgi:hypothetical protein
MELLNPILLDFGMKTELCSITWKASADLFLVLHMFHAAK